MEDDTDDTIIDAISDFADQMLASPDTTNEQALEVATAFLSVAQSIFLNALGQEKATAMLLHAARGYANMPTKH